MSVPMQTTESDPKPPTAALSGLRTASTSQGPKRPSGYGRRWAGRLITGLLLVAAIGLGYAIHGQVRPDSSTTAEVAKPGAVGSESTIWTCSMHPQIRRQEPGACPICGMDLIPAESGTEADRGLRELSISRAARALIDLRTAPVERKFVTATIRMVGKVAYDETRLGDITARVPGRLDRLYVDYTGVEVREGDHMASIYSPELYTAQGEVIADVKSIHEARSPAAAESGRRMLKSAREKLRLWGLTDEQVHAIEGRSTPSDHLTLYAPMSGIVIHKNAQEGMYVDTGSRIYTIADLSQVWVKLDAYESDLTWLRYGQTVEFATEAYPGEIFRGPVAFIDPVLDPKSRTVKVRVNVPNPLGKLKPEMFVHGEVHARVATAGRVMEPALVGKWICRMHPGVIEDGPGDCEICGMPLVRTDTLGYISTSEADDPGVEPLVVPATAVLQTGTRAVVYVELPDADRPTYEGREVVLGPRAGDYYLVRSGLEAGERVVTEGNFKLDSALQIAARPSMMNPEAALDADRHETGVTPSMAAARLSGVINASKRVKNSTSDDDPEVLRAALRGFEDALESVDDSALGVEETKAWKELSMRIRNDSVEGRWAATPDRAAVAVDRLLADVARLADRYGLDLASESAIVSAPPAFREQLSKLWRRYDSASEALVLDDPKAARSASVAASKALAEIDGELLDGPARAFWSTSRDAIDVAIRRMGEADDLAGIRSAFADWSMGMEPVVESIGLPESVGKVYERSCSMALDNAGASWLQAGEAVRNPYLGRKMPECSTGVRVAWEGAEDRPLDASDPSELR